LKVVDIVSLLYFNVGKRNELCGEIERFLVVRIINEKTTVMVIIGR